MGQSELGEYPPGDRKRPAADEAQAIAGTDRQNTKVPDSRFGSVENTVEVAVMQVDYTVEGRGDDEAPIIHVFGRTDENELVHARIHGFKPYFYAPASEVTEATLQRNERIVDWAETDENGDPYESIRGEQLIKIFGQTPRDVGQMRDEFDHYEADILFPNRFLIDKDITSGIRLPARETNGASESSSEPQELRVHHEEVTPVDVDAEPRVNTFDIEVDDRSGFPEDGEEPIICIASHDSYRDEYVLWLFDPPAGVTPPEGLSDYEPIDTDRREASGEETDLDTEIRVFETEETMLDAFLTYLDETDPDIACGWNFTDFDAPYLLDRLEVLANGTDQATRGDGGTQRQTGSDETDVDLDGDRLSRVNEVWRDDWQGPNVKGRVMFDLLYAYRRTQFTELESYKLEDIGQRELGIGKERYAGDIGDLWEENPERLLEYNLRDVELCVELDREQDIIAFWNEVRQFVGCKLEDATTPGDAVDMYVLHKLHDKFALPSKGQHAGEEYEGGAVFDPITGVRNNVSVLDLKSLYPMCMVTINASPETKVDPEHYDGETYRAPNGTRFRKDPDGAIREMVDELLSEREQKKSLRDEYDPESPEYGQYDRQQQAVKVIMNSLYGVLGWDRFRLYDREMGAAVTATGRSVIEYTEAETNELDKEVIYGDTDSVMVSIGDDVSREEAIERSFEIEERINDAYDEYARSELNADDHRFQIEFEKLYRRFFQAGKKKRYAGHIVWKEGKDVDNIDITGFEYQRSDIASITKEVQREVIEMIVTGAAIEEVTEYVTEVIEEFQLGEADPEDIGIPGGIGKQLDNYDTDTAQVRGAKYANLVLGTNFQRGSKPKRLYLDRVHAGFFERVEAEQPSLREDPVYMEFKRDPDVICFEYGDQLPDEFEIDWEKMLDKTLKGPIERILEALDVTWEEVKSGQEQKGIGEYM